MFEKKRGQIWIETVIYTLIAFIMIGLVLAFVKPKIEEIQDKTIVEQSIKLMEEINTIILSIVQGGAGNKRLIELEIKKGLLKIDGFNDELVFEVESRYLYSQPGEDIYHGSVIIHTEEKGKFNIINLTSDYNRYNIKYQGEDILKTITKSSTPYKIFISNNGTDESLDKKIIINIEIS
ncbi:MAG: hypothetical protein ACW98D_15785 [Promethearchaeota archaeon]|jgi:hypothetical protein